MRAVRHDARPLPSAAARRDGVARGLAADGIVLARLVDPLLLHRSPEGGGPALLVDLEGADLRGDRRDRRRSHHVAAGAARRRTQLGLPLLLAARRDLHADGLVGRGLSRGSAGVARVAPAQRGRQPEPAPDHVWLVRRTAADRMGGAVAARLSGRRAGAHRQRRLRSTPARRVRRAHGRHLPCAQGRACSVASAWAQQQT